MKLNQLTEARKRLYDIDDVTEAKARALFKAYGGTSSPALQNFASRVAKDSLYGELVKDHIKGITAHAEAQISEFMAHGMTEAYFDQIEATFQAEFNSPLGARAHIALMLFVLEDMFKVIGKDYPFFGRKMAEECTRIMKYGFMDVFNVISLDQAKSREKMDQRAEAIAAESAVFQQAVSGISKLLNDVSAQISNANEATSSLINDTSHQADMISEAIGSSSEELETIASSAAEMSASIDEINLATSRSMRAVHAASESASATQSDMKSLSTAVENISSVTEFISSIAEQTNLLALNATIEAARAGEAGRGFAVVANEVKALADQTSKATQEIEGRVKAIRQAVQQSCDAINVASVKLAEVVEISSSIGAAVGQQKDATSGIAGMVHSAVQRSGEIAASAKTMEHTIRQTTSASGALNNLAEQMRRESTSATLVITDFMQKLKAL